MASSDVGHGPKLWPSRLAWAARRELWLVLLVVVIGVVMAVYSVVRYTNFGAGLDLSLFDQAIWHYSRLEAPWSTIKGFDLLGDHFHPTVALLGPVYWVWSDPRMLLISASALVACSTIPVFLFARRRLSRLAAYLLALAYAGFWGLQIGVGYEFHEVELGPLLIALAILFADARRWGWFYVAIALILGVKEDMGIFVAAFGVYLVTVGERRRGGLLIVVGIAWYELATRVAIPQFSPVHAYTYWSYSQLGSNLPQAVLAALKAPWRLVTISLSPSVKAHTLLYLFAPFLFLSLWSRWFILALPFLAERFLSSRSALWGTNLDYSLTIAPVLAMSAAAGLANLTRWLGRRFGGFRWRALVPVVATAAMAITSLALSFSLSYSPFRQLLRASFYRPPWFEDAAEHAIAHVPPRAPVNANDTLLTHLSHRAYASEIASNRPVNGYVIADLGEPVGQPTGNANFAALGQVLTGYLQQTTPVYYDHDWLVAKLPSPGQRPTNGILAPIPLPIAHRLLTLTLGWQAAFHATLSGALACSQHVAQAAACPAARYGELRAAQRALMSSLYTTRRAATGPCATLAALAYADTRHVGSQLLSLQHSQPATERSIIARLYINVYYRDLPGRLSRFLVLCYPRNPTR